MRVEFFNIVFIEADTVLGAATLDTPFEVVQSIKSSAGVQELRENIESYGVICLAVQRVIDEAMIQLNVVPLF